jgi:hypothetical protein
VPDGITIEDPVNVALLATAAATQAVFVPSVCKNLLDSDVCTGSNALRALVADVCPVPPSVNARGVGITILFFTLKSLFANSVHVSPSYIYIISVLNYF